MSYRVGITGTMAAVLRVEPTEPYIICDGCGLRRTVYSQRGVRVPAKWFLDRKAAPRWSVWHKDGVRLDWCPRCKTHENKEEP